jgi:hypothetical protein
LKKVYLYVVAFITGLLPGFFLVFNFMFSDMSSLYERMLSFLIVLAAYLVLGAAFGLAGGEKGWKCGLYLSLSAVILSLLYSVNEPGTAVLNLMYGAAAAVSAVTSAHLSSKLAKKRKQ